MQISEKTISILAKIITGDDDISFYRSGPQLVNFFNEIGFEDEYGQDFPSRWYYTEENIRQLNDSKELRKVFESLLDPRNYIDKTEKRENIVEKLNKCLKYDGYKLVEINDFYKIKNLNSGNIETSKQIDQLSHEFINEQIMKCNNKLLNKDYDGAITNSRSLIEAVLVEIEKDLDENPPEYDGNLTKLYRRIKKLLNLEPNRKDINDSLKQVLGGLNSIVVGLASLRNKMSDSHVRTYKPEKHHAILVVNSAKLIVNFVLDTYKYQKNKGIL